MLGGRRAPAPFRWRAGPRHAVLPAGRVTGARAPPRRRDQLEVVASLKSSSKRKCSTWQDRRAAKVRHHNHSNGATGLDQISTNSVSSFCEPSPSGQCSLTGALTSSNPPARCSGWKTQGASTNKTHTHAHKAFRFRSISLVQKRICAIPIIPTAQSRILCGIFIHVQKADRLAN